MSEKAAVKKVKPYPIGGQMKDARGTYQGNVMRLTLSGLMIEVSGSSVQPGEKVEVNFVTPILKGAIAVKGVVVKVYNQLSGVSGGPAMTPASTSAPGPARTSGAIHLVEIHYTSVPSESMNQISVFLERTGQVKRG